VPSRGSGRELEDACAQVGDVQVGLARGRGRTARSRPRAFEVGDAQVTRLRRFELHGERGRSGLERFRHTQRPGHDPTTHRRNGCAEARIDAGTSATRQRSGAGCARNVDGRWPARLDARSAGKGPDEGEQCSGWWHETMRTVLEADGLLARPREQEGLQARAGDSAGYSCLRSGLRSRAQRATPGPDTRASSCSVTDGTSRRSLEATSLPLAASWKRPVYAVVRASVSAPPAR